MSRLMSCAETEDAVVAHLKDITRRLGWWKDKNGRVILKANDTLTLCRKVMGRRKGEPLVRLAEVQVLDVRRERLWDITEADVVREGVPNDGRFDEIYEDTGQPTTESWVRWFCEAMGCRPDKVITRIEFRYLPFTLNAKGQCPVCLVKPLAYKRDRHHFCCRCNRSFSLDTGQQIDNWAYINGVPKRLAIL